jgi:putative ubiquitin-RnfH superfamily antitoxin RatB of RatAB toxin-antitoxin module
MHVEVIYALRSRQHSVHLELADSATVATALAAIDRIAPFKDLDLDSREVGVFGRLVSREQALRPGDRIEIYRPLEVDPKEARRRRATRLPDTPPAPHQATDQSPDSPVS